MKDTFDKVTSGQTATREGSYAELFTIRHRFYRYRKAFVKLRPDDETPEMNYLKSAFAQILGDTKGHAPCVLVIGQMKCLEEINKAYETGFWKEQFAAIGATSGMSIHDLMGNK